MREDEEFKEFRDLMKPPDTYEDGKTVKEVAVLRTDLSEQELGRILDPVSMTDPRLAPKVSLG